MEAYYHNDPRIEEWIGQITEKAFTVCLLTGADADAELQKGSQIVSKVSKILLGISMFPADLLEEGLRQLLEQQLPDDRVLKNFPSFYFILNTMLQEGISKALEGREGRNDEEVDEEVEQEFKPELKLESGEDDEQRDDEFVIPALATARNESCRSIQKREGQYWDVVPQGNLAETLDADRSELNLGENKKTKPSAVGLLDMPQNSKQTTHLKYVLKKIFPNCSVIWRANILGQTFAAQVENLLICLDETEQPNIVEEDFRKEGWKIYRCSLDELSFPRRVEREIRALLRSDKKSVIV